MGELYSVHQARREDLSEGFAWVTHGEWHRRWSGRRPIVRIKSSNGTVYCEFLYADYSYRRQRVDDLEERCKTLKQQLTELQRQQDKGCVSGLAFRALAPVIESFVFSTSSAPYRRRERRESPDNVQNLRDRLAQAQQSLRELEQSLRSDPGRLRLVFIGEWYRRRLGLPKSVCKHCLDISISPRWWRQLLWQFWAGFQHPQSVVFLANMLAMLGTGLGLSGLGFGLLSLDGAHFPHVSGKADLTEEAHWAGVVLLCAGIVLSVLTLRPLMGRSRQRVFERNCPKK
jgi:hypothetical protein